MAQLSEAHELLEMLKETMSDDEDEAEDEEESGMQTPSSVGL